MLHGEGDDTRRGVVALHGVRLKTSKQASKQANNETNQGSKTIPRNETSQQCEARLSLSAREIFCRMES
jgi:hypothetical protein